MRPGDRSPDEEIAVIRCVLEPGWDDGDPPSWNPLADREQAEAPEGLDQVVVRLPEDRRRFGAVSGDQEATVLGFRDPKEPVSRS